MLRPLGSGSQGAHAGSQTGPLGWKCGVRGVLCAQAEESDVLPRHRRDAVESRGQVTPLYSREQLAQTPLLVASEKLKRTA